MFLNTIPAWAPFLLKYTWAFVPSLAVSVCTYPPFACASLFIGWIGVEWFSSLAPIFCGAASSTETVVLAGIVTADFAGWAVMLAEGSCFVFFDGITVESPPVGYVAAALETIVVSGVGLEVFASPLGFVLSSRSGVTVGSGPKTNQNKHGNLSISACLILFHLLFFFSTKRLLAFLCTYIYRARQLCESALPRIFSCL